MRCVCAKKPITYMTTQHELLTDVHCGHGGRGLAKDDTNEGSTRTRVGEHRTTWKGTDIVSSSYD